MISDKNLTLECKSKYNTNSKRSNGEYLSLNKLPGNHRSAPQLKAALCKSVHILPKTLDLQESWYDSEANFHYQLTDIKVVRTVRPSTATV